MRQLQLAGFPTLLQIMAVSMIPSVVRCGYCLGLKALSLSLAGHIVIGILVMASWQSTPDPLPAIPQTVMVVDLVIGPAQSDISSLRQLSENGVGAAPQPSGHSTSTSRVEKAIPEPTSSGTMPIGVPTSNGPIRGSPALSITGNQSLAKATPPASESPMRTAKTGSVIGAEAGAAADDASGQAWERRVLTMLSRKKVYPPSARRAAMQDTVYVRIRIDRAGRVLSCSIDHSSGFLLLDNAALDLVRRAAPLPPPPSMTGTEIEFVVPVIYALNKARR